VSAADYADRVATAVERIAEVPDPATVQLRLVECVAALGAECAYFASVVRDSDQVCACRFMLACDPGWFRHHLIGASVARDPWLAYAAHHAEPILASDMSLSAPEGPALREPGGQGGFASALLVPAHSGPGHSRISLLVLGSSRAGFFEGEGLGRFRLGARALAAELHDWWTARLRRELVARSRITPTELELLRHERLGHGSKHIARALRSTESAVNSRFQRLNGKMGTANRRAAARLAVECGLLPF
jgi:DNA-binding CsgD family transcriptional regulator